MHLIGSITHFLRHDVGIEMSRESVLSIIERIFNIRYSPAESKCNEKVKSLFLVKNSVDTILI
jgi:hypothetical protein